MPVEFDWTVSLSFLLTLVAMIYAWWRTRDLNTDARFLAIDGKFKETSDRADRMHERVNSIEQTMRSLPQKDDIHNLQLSVEKMNGKLDTMGALMVRLEAKVDQQEGYLHEVKK